MTQSNETQVCHQRERPMVEWLKTVSRHMTTIIIVLTSVWWLATPRAEEFIREAVDDRITTVEGRVVTIEEKVDMLRQQLYEVIRRLDRIEKGVEKEAEREEQRIEEEENDPSQNPR